MSSLPLPIAAFIAGLVSFLSPCVLPLVPGYVSLISGVGVEELQAQDSSQRRRVVLLSSLMFILGFSVVFIALGAVATALGSLVREYFPLLIRIAGVVIILFGLHLTGLVRIKWLYADKRLHSLSPKRSALGAFLMGFAFAFGWTPCIGPILTVILGFAAAEGTVGKGILLLAVYSLGLAVPFLLTSLGIDRFLAFYGRFKKHLETVEIASGVLLIMIGTLVFTRQFSLVATWMNKLPLFQGLVEKYL